LLEKASKSWINFWRPILLFSKKNNEVIKSLNDPTKSFHCSSSNKAFFKYNINFG
jgi:hypothetical protein